MLLKAGCRLPIEGVDVPLGEQGKPSVKTKDESGLAMDLDTQVFKAIGTGDLDALSALAGDNPSIVTARNEFGSWLHWASGKRQLPIVKYLVENGADVNLVGGLTSAGPIADAVSGGNIEIVKFLLSHGAVLDVSSTDRNALFWAISYDRVDIAELLLEAGIDPHVIYRSVTGKLKNALSYAQERGRKDIERLLLGVVCRLPIEGVDVPLGEQGKPSTRTEQESRADMDLSKQVFKAISDGDLNALSSLVRTDRSLITARNAYGSWLHRACEEGQFSIVKYLVESGADVNLRGGTSDAGPIQDAIFGGNIEVIKLLLSNGAVLDVSTPNRNSLFRAVSTDRVDIAELLLEAGIDPHVIYRSVTGKLKNALSYAQERGRKEIERILLDAGCRLPVEGVDVPLGEQGKPSAETELKGSHEEIIKHLRAIVGPVDSNALQEIVPVSDDFQIVVHTSPPNDLHPYLTIFTTGMSDRAMTVPKGKEDFKYAELVMFLPADWPHPKSMKRDSIWPVEWMRKIAYYPYLNDTWLGGPATIISSAEPPEPLGPNTSQTCLLLVADFSDIKPLAIGSDKTVRFFTVIPIYTEERDLEKKHGIARLLQSLKQGGVTAVVDPGRASVVNR